MACQARWPGYCCDISHSAGKTLLLQVAQRQLDDEGGATAAAILAAGRAAVPLRDRLHQRQPEADTARSLARAGQAVERLENALAQVWRHAGSAVAHAQHGTRALALHADRDGAGAVAARIFNQVANGA